jgi:hypothetical protein
MVLSEQCGHGTHNVFNPFKVSLGRDSRRLAHACIVLAPILDAFSSITMKWMLEVTQKALSSVSNVSGQSLRIWDTVGTELSTKRGSGLLIQPNRQPGWGSSVDSQRVWIWQVVSYSPLRYIYLFIWGLCLCSVLPVHYHSSASFKQYYLFTWGAACNLEYFSFCVFPVIHCIFGYKDSQ